MPLGLVLALVRPVRIVLGPFVDFVRSLPPLAYFSLLIIWFGIEDTSKIWLLFLAAFAPIALSVVSGARELTVLTPLASWPMATAGLVLTAAVLIGTKFPAILSAPKVTSVSAVSVAAANATPIQSSMLSY